MVWWALAAPVLVVPARWRRVRVLLLGMGGGSVARALRLLAPKADIVGVERDARVVTVARRHLDLDSLDVETIVGDAFGYLRRERRLLDRIVEDLYLFVGPSRSVGNPEWLLSEGYLLIRRRLRSDGVFVAKHDPRDDRSPAGESVLREPHALSRRAGAREPDRCLRPAGRGGRENEKSAPGTPPDGAVGPAPVAAHRTRRGTSRGGRTVGNGTSRQMVYDPAT